MPLFALDCSYSDCIHPQAQAYRMRRWVKKTADRMHVEQEARRTEGNVEVVLGIDQLATAAAYALVPEDRDRIYRAEQLESAFAECEALGGRPKLGTWYVTDATVLPMGTVGRLIELVAVPMPKAAVYFRFNPAGGEQLSPDKMFQILVMPGMTAAERRMAPERTMSPEEFGIVFRGRTPMGITRISNIKCQHCHRSLPISAFTTQGLREVDKGD